MRGSGNRENIFLLASVTNKSICGRAMDLWSINTNFTFDRHYQALEMVKEIIFKSNSSAKEISNTEKNSFSH